MSEETVKQLIGRAVHTVPSEDPNGSLSQVMDRGRRIARRRLRRTGLATFAVVALAAVGLSLRPHNTTQRVTISPGSKPSRTVPPTSTGKAAAGTSQAPIPARADLSQCSAPVVAEFAGALFTVRDTRLDAAQSLLHAQLDLRAPSTHPVSFRGGVTGSELRDLVTGKPVGSGQAGYGSPSYQFDTPAGQSTTFQVTSAAGELIVGTYILYTELTVQAVGATNPSTGVYQPCVITLTAPVTIGN